MGGKESLNQNEAGQTTWISLVVSNYRRVKSKQARKPNPTNEK